MSLERVEGGACAREEFETSAARGWRVYFEGNAQRLLTIPWEAGAELSAEEKAAIEQSLREFQAGESSEGKSLFRYAQHYARRTGDHDYVEAAKLFIAEEQRHARDLGRFLAINQIELVKTTFTDRVFRMLRHLGRGLEISIAVLITAEIIAKVYYAALREATRSTILRRLCDQILSDELQHVAFQAAQLRTLRTERRATGLRVTMALQRFLMWGTILTVWVFHRKAIGRGGYSFRAWRGACWLAFDEAFGA